MSEFKPEINPFTGKLQLVPTNTVVAFKAGVANEAALPSEGNEIGDGRITLDTHHLYVWDGVAWQDQGDIIDINWSTIVGKPSSSVENIDSAVSLKHPQNTDQYLDYGGVHQIPVEAIPWRAFWGNSTFEVNPDTGSDETGDGSSGNPYRTIQHTIDFIPPFLNNTRYIIYLQDSLNYNEQITINDKFGGDIEIQSKSADSTKVLISRNQHVFVMNTTDTQLVVKNISMRVTSNNNFCIMAEKNNSFIWVDSCKFGDNGNTGTHGVRSQNHSRVRITNCSDIDGNKVSVGIACANSIVQLGAASLFGDTNYTLSNEGLLIQGSLDFDSIEYEDAISKKHTQNEDNALITTPGTIIDVEQTLFKADEFYPVGIPIAQTYVALRNGDVSKISVIVQPSGTPDAPIILELRTVDGEGKPTDTVLGSVSKNYGDLVAPNNYTDFIFGSPITITKNTKYAIVLRTEATIGGYEFRFKLNEPYGEWYDFNDPNWILDEDLSLTFKVYLDVVQADLINEGILKQDLFVDEGIKIDGRDVSVDGTKLDTLNAIPIYEQTEEPVLTVDGSSAFWYDTNDNYRCYLIHRRGDKGSGIAEQIKVELA